MVGVDGKHSLLKEGYKLVTVGITAKGQIGRSPKHHMKFHTNHFIPLIQATAPTENELAATFTFETLVDVVRKE